MAEDGTHDYQAAIYTAKILDSHGYEAYIIGGAVRDLLLGHDPKDFDIATDARPDQITELSEFNHAIYKDTAQAYGVTRVILKINGKKSVIEVATFRKDIEAHRGRRATKVEFTDLDQDVHRRDLTINALALDPLQNTLVDLVDGVKDLENKTIRLIGSPSDRIKEDPLRILRAIRLKNQLGFSYETHTKSAIKRAVKRGELQNIAIDRLRDELTKMLVHPSRERAISDLDEFKILDLILPEVIAGKYTKQPPEFHTEGNVWQHEKLILSYLPENPSTRLVWAALLHDIGKTPTKREPATPDDRIRFDRHYAVGAEMAVAILRRLKFSKKDIQDIFWMIYHHMSIDDLPYMKPSRQQKMLGHRAFEDLLELHRADAAASWRPGEIDHKKPRFLEIENLWQEYQKKEPAKRQPSLKKDLGIDGNWIIKNFNEQLNDLPVSIIGEILQQLDTYYRDTRSKDISNYVSKTREIIKQRSRLASKP